MLALVLGGVTASAESQHLIAAPAQAASRAPQAPFVSADVVPAVARLRPDELAKMLRSTAGEKPTVLYVGFRVLYAQVRIPGAENVGPGARPEGIEKLRRRAESLSREELLVIYCGCCPWKHCPNVGPAYETLRRMGFTNLKVLAITDNLGTDWIAKGFPVEKGM
jgi:hypothetical protein